MLRYFIKRILWMIPVMLGVMLIVFTISYFTPGDPVISILGSGFTQEMYDAKVIELGLDKPFIVQFWNYLWGVISRFDFGTSYITNRPVTEELLGRFPVTFELGILGVMLTVVVGIPLGMASALKQYSALDYTATTFALIFAAVPNFVIAMVAILIFSVTLRWLPATGLSTWKAWILPVLANSISGVSVVMRMSRTSMLEVVRQDYIRTARAKGLEEGAVIRKHILKNSLIPIITVVGVQMTFIMSGSVVTETIFSIPGMGMYMLGGISNRDYPIINGCVLLLSLFICVMNLLTDFAYALVDPRIKAQYQSKKKIKKAKTSMKAEVA